MAGNGKKGLQSSLHSPLIFLARLVGRFEFPAWRLEVKALNFLTSSNQIN
mgnify:CR=1 FL=1